MRLQAVEFIDYGQLPAVRLRAPDGAQVTVTLFGAQLVSWMPASGGERLFCSTRSVLDGTKAIRGGVPIIFPQFAEQGDGMRHGFARMSHWQLLHSGVEDDATVGEFDLTSRDKLAARWPHDFALSLRVAVRADQLNLRLRVRNTGTHAFEFAAALHSYFAVSDSRTMTIAGLQDTDFSDQLSAEKQRITQTENLLACPDRLDRIYHRAASDLVISDATRRLTLAQDGFVDAVVWNPGQEAAAAMSDMGADEYRRFMCIEAAHIEPIRLRPATEWLGYQRCTAR